MKSLKIVLIGIFGIVGCFFLINGIMSSSQTPVPAQILNEEIVTYPFSLPGDTITVRKVLKNGGISLESNSPLITSANDLVNLEQKELAAKKQLYGPLSDNLFNILSQLNETDSIVVKIILKIQPLSVPLDKTKYSVAQLMAQAKEYLNRIPIIDKGSFLSKYGIAKASLNNKSVSDAYDNTPDMIISKTNKKTIRNLYLDNNIVSIEKYEEKKPCQACVSCVNSGGGQTHPPCLSTLASSAYNPASAMPSNAMGQGVNAATFESGLRTAFVNCINLGSKLKHYDPNYNNFPEINHSETCFRCLTDVAPQANFIHINSWDYSTNPSITAILNWGIQTVSMSMTSSYDYSGSIPITGSPDLQFCDQTPINSEMISVDSWAYQYPYPVFCNPTGNGGYCHNPHWACYNAINVGNVQHYHQTHYRQTDTVLQKWCAPLGIWSGHCIGGCEQAANPPPLYGSPTLNNPFNCNPTCCGTCSQFNCNSTCCPSCDPGPRSDRELPMVVAPGMSPYLEECAVGTDMQRMSDPCILNDAGNACQYISQGTSLSAPILNGIAACVISADTRMGAWPEKVRAVILATAQNIDFNYWNYQQDGRNGAGVVCGSDAVWFAKNHVIAGPSQTAVSYGMFSNILTSSSQNQIMQFNIRRRPEVGGKIKKTCL